MSEQQRMMLAVVMCGLIVVGWQFLSMELAPEVPAQTATQVEKGNGGAVESSVNPAAHHQEKADAAGGSPSATHGGQAPQTGTDAVGASVVAPQVRPFATGLLQGAMSNAGPSLTELSLLEYNEHAKKGQEGDDGTKHPVSLANAHVGKDGPIRQAEVIWNIGDQRVSTTLAMRQQGSVFTFEGDAIAGVRVQAEITPRANEYGLDYKLGITNGTGAPLVLGATVVLRLYGAPHSGGFLAPPSDLIQGLCSVHDVGVERIQADELRKDGPYTERGAIAWAGIDRQYFVAAVVPHTRLDNAACVMNTQENTITVDYALGQSSVAPGGAWQQDVTVYMGPKRAEALAAVSGQLSEVIDYSIWGIPLGFLARPMVFLMNIFHQWTASWGLAIVLLTLVVKLLLFPVTYKSVLSMRRMQLIKPEMDKLRERFKDDRERQQMEQLKLFREKGVNPLGGCLPMLLQMPVWFALYRTLWTSVDLYQQPFLWLSDLTQAETFPILALILGAVTFVQQKLTPTTMDSQQAKMMLYMMPIMLTVFMIALPSGLVLYILVNSILTIVQQLAINRREVTLG